MRKFIVNVNGTSYEVEVEEIQAGESADKRTAPAPVAPVSATGGNTITAPMPGTIISVNVKPGDSFRNGQVLLVLEAMKMENEIMAHSDGKVIAVNVQKGSAVNSGDVLIAYN